MVKLTPPDACSTLLTAKYNELLKRPHLAGLVRANLGQSQVFKA